MPTTIIIDGVTLTLKKYPEFAVGTPVATDITLFSDPVNGDLFKTTMDNLIANILYVDGVTITGNGSSGNPLVSTGSVTADNGLEVDPAGNIRLGGQVGLPAPLIHKTYIDGGSSFNLNITGDYAIGTANAVLKIENIWSGGGLSIALRGDNNSNFGAGVYGQATSGNGVWGVGSVGIYGDGTTYGVFGITSAGTGVVGISLSGYAGWLQSAPVANNTVNPTLKIERIVDAGGSGANDIGSSTDFYNSSGNGTSRLSNQIISKFTIATDATRTSQFIITGVYNANPNTLFTASGNGDIEIGDVGAISQQVKITIDNTGKNIYLDSRGGNTILGDVFGTVNATYLGLNDTDKLIQFNSDRIQLKGITATVASALPLVGGTVVFATTTDATFTSVGFWGYDGSAWTQF